MKKIIFMTFFCLSFVMYISAEDSLYMKCNSLPDFSLNSSVTLEDSLYVNIFEDKYNIVFSQDIQSLTYSDTTISDIDFFEIQLLHSRYLGYEDSIGLPKLPTINFTLQIPSALYDSTFVASNITCLYEDYNVNSYYYPYQDFMGDEQPELLFSEQYYSNDYPLTNYVEISTPFKAGNTTGIVVKIRPIQYNPQAGKIRIIKSISFDVPITEVPLTDIFVYEMLDAEEVIDAPVLSEYTHLPFDENYLGKLLIVISDESYREELNEFEAHKQSKGYETEVVSINQIKDLMGASQVTSEVLRNYLRGRYLNDYVLYRPRYLLLVGNYDVIPYSLDDYEKGNWFYSDLYYGCLNKTIIRNETDYFPEMFVGRWPVSSISQLQVAINKTITFENTIGNFPTLYNIMMLSGIEKFVGYNDKAEVERYKTIVDMQNTLKDFLYQNVDIYKGRNFLNKKDSINNILKEKMKDDLWMFVYVGHGSSYMLKNPTQIEVVNLVDFEYDKIPPIAISFACSTNQITEGNTCYGRTWLLNENSGGVLHYGATGDSYRNLNRTLAVGFSKTLNANLKKTISVSLQIASAKLNFNISNIQNSLVRNHIEKYCIYGDPSLLMFGGLRDDQMIQYSKEINNLENSTIDNIDLFEDILINRSFYVYVYDANGKLLISDNSNNIISKLNSLPIGVYFVYLQGNNISKSYKLVVNK